KTVSREDRCGTDLGSDSEPGARVKTRGLLDRDPLDRGVGNDRLAEWMLGARFRRCGGKNQLALGSAPEWRSRLHDGAAEGQGPGFVQHHGVNAPQNLQVQASLYDGTQPRSASDPP